MSISKWLCLSVVVIPAQRKGMWEAGTLSQRALSPRGTTQKGLQSLAQTMPGAFRSGWITLQAPLGVAPNEQALGAPGC